MAKVKFTKRSKGLVLNVSLEIPVDEILDTATTRNVGKTVVDEMIAFMEKGVSPVKGKRFEQYKNPSKYPGGRKPKTPVNLKLSGDLYASLSFRQKDNVTMEIGLINPKGDVAIYGPVHNRDDKGRPDIPERRFLPTRRGEEFNRSIMLAIKRVLVARLNKLLKK